MRRGFTLIEVLVTLAVLAILLGLSATGLSQYRKRLALNQAATQLATDLNRARSQARRTSTRQAVSAPNGATRYTIASPGRTVVRGLPGGVRFYRGATVTFYPPYGNTDATPKQFVLEGVGGERVFVNVVGIGGKAVVVRAR